MGARFIRIGARSAFVGALGVSLTTGCAALLSLSDYEPGAPLIAGEDGPSEAVEGSVPIDAAGPVLATCGGTTCKPHEVCADSGMTAACACGFGYSRADAGACVFSAGPRDPTFEATPPSSWKVGGGASVNPDASIGTAGTFTLPVGHGIADLTGGFVEQTFDMPEVSYAEPIALEMYAKDSVVSGGPEVGWGAGTLPFRVNSSAYDITRVCLGEKAFGKKTTLRILGKTTIGPYLDYATYVPTADCPMPGSVLDGAFEGSGWKMMGRASLAPGVGVAGSRAGTLTSTSCDEDAGSFEGIISVPASPAGAALRFYHKGPADRRVRVAGGNVVDRGLLGSDEVCLPAWSRGLAIPVVFSMAPAMSPCSSASSIIDDVSLVASPSCGDGFLFDGGFEGPVSYWSASRLNTQAQAQVATTDQRTAAAAFRFDIFSCNTRASAYQEITVPPAKGTSGPAIAFWTRTVGGSGISFSLNGVDLTPGAASYTKSVRCLPPSRVGRSYLLDFSITGGNTPCFGAVMLDDVELTVDPSCPSQ